MLGEGKWQSRRVFELAEVVTICDHFGFLARAELKHEIRGKAAAIALDGLIQSFRARSINLCKIRIKHDAMATNKQDASGNTLAGHDGSGFSHVAPI
jgi:hypothetical protein